MLQEVILFSQKPADPKFDLTLTISSPGVRFISDPVEQVVMDGLEDVVHFIHFIFLSQILYTLTFQSCYINNVACESWSCPKA